MCGTTWHHHHAWTFPPLLHLFRAGLTAPKTGQSLIPTWKTVSKHFCKIASFGQPDIPPAILTQNLNSICMQASDWSLHNTSVSIGPGLASGLNCAVKIGMVSCIIPCRNAKKRCFSFLYGNRIVYWSATIGKHYWQTVIKVRGLAWFRGRAETHYIPHLQTMFYPQLQSKSFLREPQTIYVIHWLLRLFFELVPIKFQRLNRKR